MCGAKTPSRGLSGPRCLQSPGMTRSLADSRREVSRRQPQAHQKSNILPSRGGTVSLPALHMAYGRESPQALQHPSSLPSPALPAPVLPIPSSSRSRMLPARVPTLLTDGYICGKQPYIRLGRGSRKRADPPLVVSLGFSHP